MGFFVGTAGWTIPKQHLSLFPQPAAGAKPSHLELYGTELHCAEINSSFHRSHRRATWERWAATTPEDFRFSVKAPKAVTHIAKLVNSGPALLEFFQGVYGLGPKLGPVLVQLPPKLAFDEAVAQEFFTTMRELHSGSIVLEPRHASWFAAAADRLLQSFNIARVAADPPKGSKRASQPGGWKGLRYWRLHGAPRTYYSEYDERWLQAFLERVTVVDREQAGSETWIIFDNTALGYATAHAAWLKRALRAASASGETASSKPHPSALCE